MFPVYHPSPPFQGAEKALSYKPDSEQSENYGKVVNIYAKDNR
nr:MAG TPA: hypothetical protein [Caudoviricetes sp.]